MSVTERVCVSIRRHDGIEQAIRDTADQAKPPVHAQVTGLAAALAAGARLPVALTSFKADVDHHSADLVATALRKAAGTHTGGKASHVVADLGDTASIRQAVDAVVERHGRLDVAFNNAGVAVAPHPVAGFPEDDFDLVVRVNFTGTFYAVGAEVEAMRRTAGSGAIVNISSVGSLLANPALAAYGAAKRAVNSLTASAAVTYAPQGVRVNAIALGLVLTEMVADWQRADPGVVERIIAGTPQGCPAQPREIAEAAAWPLSDRSSYVAGVVLPVTGGTAA